MNSFQQPSLSINIFTGLIQSKNHFDLQPVENLMDYYYYGKKMLVSVIKNFDAHCDEKRNLIDEKWIFIYLFGLLI